MSTLWGFTSLWANGGCCWCSACTAQHTCTIARTLCPHILSHIPLLGIGVTLCNTRPCMLNHAEP